MAAISMSELNIGLINELRNVAAKSSVKVDMVKFFAETSYAHDTVEQLMTSESSSLSDLARRAYASFFKTAADFASSARASNAPQMEAPRKAPMTQAERFSAIKDMMTHLAVDASRVTSLLFILKLEKCDSIDDLRDMYPALKKLLFKKRGEEAVPVLKQVAALLK
jgi:hypothetical protein